MMNGKQVAILKETLDKINEELYEEIPLVYADKAIMIIKRNISKIIKKLLFE